MDDEQEQQEGLEVPEQESTSGQDDNGNDENSEEQAQQEAEEEERKKKEREEKKIEKDLTKLDTALTTRQVPLFTPNETETLNKAKKNKKFLPKLTSIFTKFSTVVTKFFSKIFSIIAPALPPIGLALLIFLGLALVVFVGFAIYSYFSGDSSNTFNSTFGVKGDKFYGVRTLYEDEEKATVELVNEYYMIISDTATEIQKVTSIPNAGEDGESVGVTISVVVELLEEGETIETFDETEFSATYPSTYKLINDIATEVYKVDNAEGAQPATLAETLKEIKYFGLDTNLNATIKDLVADYIINQGGYTYTAESGATLNKTQVDAEVQKKIDNVFNKDKYKTRTEKLFIKDYIFTGTDKGMENIEKLNYKTAIFMPKQQVTFNSFWFVIIDAEISQFNLTLACNGENVNLTKSKEGMFGDNNAYNYKSIGTVGKTVDAYNYVALPKDDVSVFDLIEDEAYSSLLKDGEEAGVKEFNFNEDEGCVITFENGSEESFGWYEQDIVYK